MGGCCESGAAHTQEQDHINELGFDSPVGTPKVQNDNDIMLFSKKRTGSMASLSNRSEIEKQ